MSKKIAAVVSVCLLLLAVGRLLWPPQSAGDRAWQSTFSPLEPSVVWELPLAWPDSTVRDRSLPVCSMPVIHDEQRTDSMPVMHPDPTRHFTMTIVPANCVAVVRPR
jgi:hypothetical protein